ncbi:MAG TPA: VOC family protein [Myxococcota bacterium]|jgi:catechol 2,3-dioxygenase-like lactoylglutathione lyase family enzyme
MPLHRLASLTIGVPAPEPVRGFYRDFGLAETKPGRFETADGGEQLRIQAAPWRRLLALAIGVDDADDLGRVAAALARLGVETERGERALEAVEPVTGVRVRLAVEARVAQKPPSALALNAPGRTQRSDARSPAVLPGASARPRRLSHVVIGSPDAPASKRFFTEGIGLRVSDEVPAIGASFLRCSTDHHNLLVQSGPVAFLHHTAWEMDDVDAVGRAAAAMLAADPSRHVWGLGRHGIGSNFFWYLRDPAGNFAEYSSDLDVIADAEAWRVSASTGAHPLAAWGPPVPGAFLAPPDIVAMTKGG